MNISVILTAAGLGTRFAAGGRRAGSKVEYELDGKAVFLHACDLFLGRVEVTQVLLAVDPEKLDDFRFRWEDKLSFMGVTLVAGGRRDRWETVNLALSHVADGVTHIAVHDAARPLASAELIDRVFAAARSHPAVVPGLPLSDTVKRADDTDRGSADRDPLDALLQGGASPEVRPIAETVPRAGLYGVQTPQVFERGLLESSYAELEADTAEGITDDASVVERAGHTVHLVEGDPLNLKLTRPADAELLDAVLRMRRDTSAKQAAERMLFGDDED